MLRLLTLDPASSASDRSEAVHIVIVPSLESDKPPDWAHSSGSWIQKLSEDLDPTPQVWEFVYPTPEKGINIVQQSLKSGRNLVESLEKLYGSVDQRTRPLILICHGFGGYTMFKALSILREQPFLYREVADIVSSVVLLGVPNIKSSTKAHDVLELMVKCRSRTLGKVFLSAADVDSISSICGAFEVLPLNAPVTTIYEKQETLIQRRQLHKNLEQVIVNQKLSKFNKSGEMSIGADANQLNICKLPVTSDAFTHLTNHLKKIALEAPKNIARKFATYSVPNGLQNLSLQSNAGSEPPVLETSDEAPDDDHVRVGRTGNLIVPDNDPYLASGRASDPSPARGTDGSTQASFTLIPSSSTFEATSRIVKLPTYSFATHQKNNDFLGRSDILKQIDEVLLPKSNGADENEANVLRSFAICGLGGMGKTEVAVEYAQTRTKVFDAIFWLTADDLNLLEISFARIAQQLNLQDSGEKDTAASRELVKGWLSSPVRQTSNLNAEKVKWLLVFDNVDNMDMLSDFWPTHGHGSILITSRDPLAKHNVYTVHDGIDLPSFSKQETAEFLERTTKIKAQGSNKEALAQIADRLHGLPLAAKQVGAIIRESRMSYVAFLKFYDREGIQQIQKMHEKLGATDHSRHWTTVWALEKLPSDAKALLYVISLLNPENIPEDMMSCSSSHLDLPDYPNDPSAYVEARASLLRSSLINQNEDEAALSVHRLVQDTTKSLLDGDLLGKSFLTAFALVQTAWPLQKFEDHHSTDRFEECSRLFPSILRLKNGLEKLFNQSKGYKVDYNIANLLNDSGWYLFERGLPDQSKSFFTFALQICDRLDSQVKQTEDVQSVIRQSHCFLGCAESETNNMKASLTHFMHWLSMVQSRKDEDGHQIIDYELGIAHNEAGCAHASNAMLDEAIEYFQQSIDIFQKVEDYDETWLGWPEPNLGLVYWMQGRHKESQEILEKSIATYARVYGYDDTKSFKTGKMLYALGNVFESLQQYDKSLEAHHRCLKQYRVTLGNSHPRTADICYKLAGHYIRLEAWEDAQRFLNQALKIYSERSFTIGQLARATFRQAKLWRLMGREEDASIERAKAVNLRKRCVLYDRRKPDELTEYDFDSLLGFMSR